MNRKVNYERSIESKRQSVRANEVTRTNSRRQVGANAIQTLQPFASAFFSELARIAAAQYAEQDMGSGSGVVAQEN